MEIENWHKEETYKSLIQIGMSVLKFVLLANGGAAVALLAFIGKIYSPDAQIPNVTVSLGWFLAGLFSGGLAHFMAYITQLRLYKEPEERVHLCIMQRHETWLYISMGLVLAGIFCFGIGCWFGVNSISGQASWCDV